jgi:membrane protease YdiL (CAAX protease family)
MTWDWPKIWNDERGGWWRVLVILGLFLGGMLLGNALILAASLGGPLDAMKSQSLYVQQIQRPVAILLTSSSALTGFLVGVRLVHHKPASRVFTDGRPFKLGFAVRSAVVWSVLWFAGTLPIRYRWVRLVDRAVEIPLPGWIVLALMMFCATAVQGTLEEVVFRGYLQTHAAAWMRRTWAAVAIVAVLFTSLHFDAWT